MVSEFTRVLTGRLTFKYGLKNTTAASGREERNMGLYVHRNL